MCPRWPCSPADWRLIGHTVAGVKVAQAGPAQVDGVISRNVTHESRETQDTLELLIPVENVSEFGMFLLRHLVFDRATLMVEK